MDIESKSKLYLPIVVIVFLVFLFQLTTLSAFRMNGDEAIYMLIMEELGKITGGQWPSMNPIIHYSGPLNFWALGSVYALTSMLPQIEPAAWMVRLPPFLFFWIGTWFLFAEIRRWSLSSAMWFLFFAAITPMTLVYSRVAFPHSFMLGLFSVCVAESMRIYRTGNVRLLLLFFLAGVSADLHTTAVFGMAVVFMPVARIIARQSIRQPGRFIIGCTFFLVIAYPVIRNFPPPIEAGAEKGRSILMEVRNLLNIVSGYQPYIFWLHKDIAPNLLLAVFLCLTGYVMYREWWAVKRSSYSLDKFLKAFFLLHIVGTAVILFMCYSGRSLVLIGHERYFLSLVPGWVLIASDAFRRWSGKLGGVFLALLFVFYFSRLAIPVVGASMENDPSLLAARWLVKHCPSRECVAVAENFWNYWPIRYYTRDSIDLNYHGDNWKTARLHALNGRETASCWYAYKGVKFVGTWKNKVDFIKQSGSDGETCFLGSVSKP
ncbi:MAG: hypothetical protein AABZ06_01010 [Bdellovibrionota bacterium]